MRLSEFIAGLKILEPYFNDPTGFHIGAEHDQFYVHQTDKPLSPEDVAAMRALGWFQPETDSEEEYFPEEGWSAFT
jgi:hypothetical protein